jgi:hypothetical protein
LPPLIAVVSVMLFIAVVVKTDTACFCTFLRSRVWNVRDRAAPRLYPPWRKPMRDLKFHIHLNPNVLYTICNVIISLLIRPNNILECLQIWLCIYIHFFNNVRSFSSIIMGIWISVLIKTFYLVISNN